MPNVIDIFVNSRIRISLRPVAQRRTPARPTGRCGAVSPGEGSYCRVGILAGTGCLEACSKHERG